MEPDALSSPRISMRMVLASIVGLWFCFFVLVTVRSWVLDWDSGWDQFWRRGVVTLAGMALTLLLWRALQLFHRCATWIKIVAALVLAMPVSMMAAQVNFLAFRDLDEGYKEKTVVIKVRRDMGDDLLRDTRYPPYAPTPPALPDPPETTGVEETEIVIGEPIEDDPPPTTIPLPGIGEIELASWGYVTDMAFGRYFMLLSWCALYLALMAGERARLAERREGEYHQAAKAAELRSLRYQINPHFLFNTLNSLSALVLTDKAERAERMIQTLSDFYRRSLSGDPTGDHPLSREIELQQLYLEIEAVRFPDRLRTRFELSTAVTDALVPGMILQPLVENSVKYGVAASPKPVTITIAARVVEGALELSVSDDGPMTGTGDPHGFGIGLGNVRDRLRARFGDNARLVFGAHKEGGFETILTMPIQQTGGQGET